MQTVTFIIRSSQANLGGPRDTDAFPESQSNANVIHTVSGVRRNLGWMPGSDSIGFGNEVEETRTGRWERNDRDLARVLSLEISMISSLSRGANVEYSLNVTSWREHSYDELW